MRTHKNLPAPCGDRLFLPKTPKKVSAQPESNQRPRDINCKQLQSPALPTELYADFDHFLRETYTQVDNKNKNGAVTVDRTRDL